VTYAISDIHGCLISFNTLLQALDLSLDDTLITLGDYIDRGPDSKGVIDRILELRHQAAHKQGPQIITLCGNHELMMKDARNDSSQYTFWAMNGGKECLESFKLSPDDTLDSIPTLYWDFFDSLSPYHETDTHIIVHGGYDDLLPMSDQLAQDLYWKRFHLLYPHESGKTAIVGHTIQPDGYPATSPGVIGIDTGSFRKDGWTTALSLEDHSYLQANEKGETRSGTVPA